MTFACAITIDDPSGAADDGGVELSSAAPSQICFSPTPGPGAPGRTRCDGLSILTQKLGHIFGVDGFRTDPEPTS